MVKPIDPYLANILEGEKITIDDTTKYQESTHEKQQEFAKNRNYHYSNTDNPIDFPVPKKEKKVNEDVCPVYDLESKHWKSFRWDSVKQVTLTI